MFHLIPSQGVLTTVVDSITGGLGQIVLPQYPEQQRRYRYWIHIQDCSNGDRPPCLIETHTSIVNIMPELHHAFDLPRHASIAYTLVSEKPRQVKLVDHNFLPIYENGAMAVGVYQIHYPEQELKYRYDVTLIDCVDEGIEDYYTMETDQLFCGPEILDYIAEAMNLIMEHTRYEVDFSLLSVKE